MNIKTKLIITIIISFLLVIAILGVTYALYRSNVDGNGSLIRGQSAVISTSFINGDTINLSNAHPIYDINEENDAQKILFSVTNTSTNNTPGTFRIDLGVNSISETLKSQYFKWSLYQVSNEIYTKLNEGNFAGAIVSNDLLLKSDETISVGATKSYELRVWISYSDSENQTNMLGTSFEGKVKATSYVNH